MMVDSSSRTSQERREWAMAFRERKKNKLDKPKLCVVKILLTTKYKTKMFSNLKAFMINMSKYKNAQRPKKSEARWKASSRKGMKNNRMAITAIHACFITHYLIIFKRHNLHKIRL